jgi:hypothetical protein
MTRRLTLRLSALAGVLAVACVSLALLAPAASATGPFCGGHRIANFESCYGPAQWLNGDTGMGVEHSICIGAGAIWGGCAPVGTWKGMTLEGTVWAQPWIQDNAAGSTVVWGETF